MPCPPIVILIYCNEKMPHICTTTHTTLHNVHTMIFSVPLMIMLVRPPVTTHTCMHTHTHVHTCVCAHTHKHFDDEKAKCRLKMTGNVSFAWTSVCENGSTSLCSCSTSLCENGSTSLCSNVILMINEPIHWMCMGTHAEMLINITPSTLWTLNLLPINIKLLMTPLSTLSS